MTKKMEIKSINSEKLYLKKIDKKETELKQREQSFWGFFVNGEWKL